MCVENICGMWNEWMATPYMTFLYLNFLIWTWLAFLSIFDLGTFMCSPSFFF